MPGKGASRSKSEQITRSLSRFTQGGQRRSCPALGRPTFSLSPSAMLLLLGSLLHVLRGADAQGFEYGDPIDVVVTAGDSLSISFDGDLALGLAVSFQQCSGDAYMSMNMMFNNSASLVEDTNVETSRCVRVVGSSATEDEQAVNYDNLCTFQNSGPVGVGYLSESSTLSSSLVNPDLITAEFSNPGTTTATGQVVMFSTTYPAPSSDELIDRVEHGVVQDGNTYTVEAKFQADGGETENFCAGASGCSVEAYYIEIDDTDTNADLLFSTVCQARNGVLVYDGFTGAGDAVLDGTTDTDAEDTTTTTDELTTAEETTDDAVAAQTGERRSRALSATAFEIAACVEFPKNTEATYLLYLVVSPDTASFTQVGYGFQDQLLYASDSISVEGNADVSCPEVVETVEGASSGTPGARPMVLSGPAKRASGAMAAGLTAAAAAASSRLSAAEL